MYRNKKQANTVSIHNTSKREAPESHRCSSNRTSYWMDAKNVHVGSRCRIVWVSCAALESDTRSWVGSTAPSLALGGLVFSYITLKILVQYFVRGVVCAPRQLLRPFLCFLGGKMESWGYTYGDNLNRRESSVFGVVKKKLYLWGAELPALSESLGKGLSEDWHGLTSATPVRVKTTA